MLGRWGKGKTDVDCEAVRREAEVWASSEAEMVGWISTADMLIRAAPRDLTAFREFHITHVLPALGLIAEKARVLLHERQKVEPSPGTARLHQLTCEWLETVATIHNFLSRRRSIEAAPLMRERSRLEYLIAQEKHHLTTVCPAVDFDWEWPRGSVRERGTPPPLPQEMTEIALDDWITTVDEWHNFWTGMDSIPAEGERNYRDGQIYFIVPLWTFGTHPEFAGFTSHQVLQGIRFAARLAQGEALWLNSKRSRTLRQQSKLDWLNVTWKNFAEDWMRADHRQMALGRFGLELFSDVQGYRATFQEYSRPLPWENS